MIPSSSGSLSGSRTGPVIKVLNVAEKPSTANAVANILSNQKFDRVGGDIVFRYLTDDTEMIFTSVDGHILEYMFSSSAYETWNSSVDPAKLLDVNVSVEKREIPNKSLIIENLKNKAKLCRRLILWLDNDMEGENIASEVVAVCRGVNPHLQFFRACFRTLQKSCITHAVENLTQINKSFSDAVDFRAEVDFRSGRAFTRFQTNLLRSKFDFSTIDKSTIDKSLVLSYGTCLFPTLGFIVDRCVEIERHVPAKIYELKCEHKTTSGTTQFSYRGGKLTDYGTALSIFNSCQNDLTAHITDFIVDRTQPVYPPKPLTTHELLNRAFRFLKMSVARTMEVAEDLYLGGLISYPRTGVDSYKNVDDLNAFIAKQSQNVTLRAYCGELIELLKKNRFGKRPRHWEEPHRYSNQREREDEFRNGQEPIYPIAFSKGGPQWSEDHKRLYDFIVRHFLASMSPIGKKYETTIEIDVAGYLFSATSTRYDELFFVQFYPYDKPEAISIPNSYSADAPNDVFMLTGINFKMELTKSPALVNEAELLDLMRTAQIGTNATMHHHIQNLIEKHYAKNDGSNLKSTKLGEALVAGYRAMGVGLCDPALRRRLEADMKAISVDIMQKEAVLSRWLREMTDLLLKAQKEKDRLVNSFEQHSFVRRNTSGPSHQGSGHRR